MFGTKPLSRQKRNKTNSKQDLAGIRSRCLQILQNLKEDIFQHQILYWKHSGTRWKWGIMEWAGEKCSFLKAAAEVINYVVGSLDQISCRWSSASLSYRLGAIRCAWIFQFILLKSRGGVASQDGCRFCKISRSRSFNARFFFDSNLVIALWHNMRMGPWNEWKENIIDC